MAERIQVNFGWLNDYSGAKFAPLTLSDKILMTNSDKTFDAHVNDAIEEWRIRQEETEKNLKNIKRALKALDAPYDNLNNYLSNYPNDDSKNLILDVIGANRLINLKSNGGVGDTTSDNYGTLDDLYEAFGVNIGENLVPIYFKHGAPLSCTTISSVDSLSSNLYINFENNEELKKNHGNFEITDTLKNRFNYGEFADGKIDAEHKGRSPGLKVNIKGNARSATEALFAF